MMPRSTSRVTLHHSTTRAQACCQEDLRAHGARRRGGIEGCQQSNADDSSVVSLEAAVGLLHYSAGACVDFRTYFPCTYDMIHVFVWLNVFSFCFVSLWLVFSPKKLLCRAARQPSCASAGALRVHGTTLHRRVPAARMRRSWPYGPVRTLGDEGSRPAAHKRLWLLNHCPTH